MWRQTCKFKLRLAAIKVDMPASISHSEGRNVLTLISLWIIPIVGAELTSFAFSVSLSKNKSSLMFVDEVSKMKINLLLPLGKPSYLSLLRTTRSSTRGMNCLLHFSFGARPRQRPGARRHLKVQNPIVHRQNAGHLHPTLPSCIWLFLPPSPPGSNELAPWFWGWSSHSGNFLPMPSISNISINL